MIYCCTVFDERQQSTSSCATLPRVLAVPIPLNIRPTVLASLQCPGTSFVS